MGKDRAQVLVWGLAALLLIVSSAFVMDWFRAAMFGLGVPGAHKIAIDLHSIPTLAARLGFWGNLVFVGLILWQCGSRLLSGAAIERVSRLGYTLGCMCIVNAVLAGFMFAPDSQIVGDVGVAIQRTWAPAMLIVGDIAGLVALYTAVHDFGEGDAPVVPVLQAKAKVTQHRGAATGSSHLPDPLATPPPRMRAPSSVPIEGEGAPLDSGVRLKKRPSMEMSKIADASSSADIGDDSSEPKMEMIAIPPLPGEPKARAETNESGAHDMPTVSRTISENETFTQRASTDQPTVARTISENETFARASTGSTAFDAKQDDDDDDPEISVVEAMPPTPAPIANRTLDGIGMPTSAAASEPAIARTKSDPAIARTKSDPAVARTKSDPAVARTKSGPMVARTSSAQIRGKLKYATATAQLTRAGIDARREDGASMLVLWRDVVGIVARRLPPEAPYDGATFVDLVSTSGSTLRVLPWTRLTGDPVEGEGEVRARSLVQVVATRCPEIQIDPATRRFLGTHGPAAQLPDAATLAQHDARLA